MNDVFVGGLCKTFVKPWLTTDVHEKCREEEEEMNKEEDICGLCGLPGADKYAHPIHWPGERIPDGPLVHAECEQEECRRAHAALTDKEIADFLRTI